MKDFLASRNFSLACALLNGVFALSAFSNGSWLFGLLCAGFAGLCTRNYLIAGK